MLLGDCIAVKGRRGGAVRGRGTSGRRALIMRRRRRKGGRKIHGGREMVKGGEGGGRE